MKTVLDLDTISRNEKLRIMEELWVDLSREDEKLISPSWHEDALKKTEEARISNGTQPIDWDTAKKELHARFQ